MVKESEGKDSTRERGGGRGGRERGRERDRESTHTRRKGTKVK
jgi:hypothetical protein